MRKLFLPLLFISTLQVVRSQTFPVITEGSIIFERKINLFSGKNLSTEYKVQNNQFRTTYYQLQFSKNYSAYTPFVDNLQLNREGIQPAENNIVYTDQQLKVYQSTKKIFDETFVVEDTLPRISWKITSEKQTIAGFECRRANALIFDSVYIVAFYTDDIPASSGPELFNGLPGMVLGVALPHLHINIFATRVFSQPINEASLHRIKPNKSPVSASNLKETLIKSSAFWGPDAFSFLIQGLL